MRGHRSDAVPRRPQWGTASRKNALTPRPAARVGFAAVLSIPEPGFLSLKDVPLFRDGDGHFRRQSFFMGSRRVLA